MKRYGYLFERICSLDNLRAAACNAAQGKRRRDEVQKFLQTLKATCKRYARNCFAGLTGLHLMKSL